VAREVERQGLYFKYAVHYAAQHKGEPTPAQVSPAMWRGFRDFLAEAKLRATEAQLQGERVDLERGLRRELARRLGGPTGDGLAFRVASEGDTQLARALDLLRRARTPGELVRLSAR